MTEYTPKERLYRALRKQPVDRMPAVCFTQTATVEQMEASGAYWPEAHADAEKNGNTCGSWTHSNWL